VPADWIDKATARQVDSFGCDGAPDWVQGYGYQFWRCRHDAYRGDGAFGQYCIIMPGQSAVLAITAGVSDMQSVLDRVWQDLLPALRPAAIPEDAGAQDALGRELSSLALPTAAGKPSSPLAGELSGKAWRFGPNDQNIQSIQLGFDANQLRLTIQDLRASHTIALGYDRWLDGISAFDTPAGPRPVAASGAWTDDHTFVARLHYTQTPFSPTLTFRFADQTLSYHYHVNLVFGSGVTDREVLVGDLAKESIPFR
jgi:hypothetical protein